MCKILKVSRSNYYSYNDKVKTEQSKDPMTDIIKRVFRDNKKAYGTRRLKKALNKEGYQVSRRRIGRIMAEEGLVSVYTKAKYKVYKTTPNESLIGNKLDREFDGKKRLEAIVSDLTYVRVKNKWNYICTIMDLHNREVIGYSAGANKDAKLVYQAFSSIKNDLNLIGLFHTDRGKEFVNKHIDKLLDVFKIERSLSAKGTPYDNAVAESNFKSLKIEFVYQHKFHTLDQLQKELGGHIWWYNNERLHSSLDYNSPIEYITKHS